MSLGAHEEDPPSSRASSLLDWELDQCFFEVSSFLSRLFSLVWSRVKRVLMGTLNREPQENSRNIQEYVRILVGIFLLYSYHILGVPCLGFPVKFL